MSPWANHAMVVNKNRTYCYISSLLVSAFSINHIAFEVVFAWLLLAPVFEDSSALSCASSP